ncbi:hypothetical protein KXS11_10070 [Plantibacter flavus]|uniref:hypothetical protein n=1 Tax=Plantibacter flavus TaxID=150123 RepID=UPI003F174D4D
MADRLRFDTGARYGAALVGVLFAGYLNIATDFSAFIQASNYAGSLGTDVPLVNVVQFLTIVGLYVASFSIMPVDGARRVAAVTLACTVLFTWATLGIERGTGSIVHPVEFWQFVLNQGFITLVVGLGGWFIVRGRRFGWIAFLVVFVPPIVGSALDIAAVTSGTYTLLIEGTVVVCGLAAAWLGALVDGAVARLARDRRGRPASVPA